MTHTLVEVQPERFVVLDDAGRLCGFIPWVPGDAPVVEGAHPSLGAFPLDEACAHIKRWLSCRLVPVGESERERIAAEACPERSRREAGMPEPDVGVSRAGREVSGLVAESLRIAPADVFRWEVQQLVDDLLPAWLRAYHSVDTRGRIRLELSVRLVSEKEAGDGDD